MNEKKQELYFGIRTARIYKDFYYELARKAKCEDIAKQYTDWADDRKAREAALTSELKLLYGETISDVDKFITEYNMYFLNDAILRCRSYIINARFHNSKSDFQRALDSYNDMKIIAKNLKLDTEECRACKADFEQTFAKELSKKKRRTK